MDAQKRTENGAERIEALRLARAEIDRIDAQLAALFEARMEAVRAASDAKRALGLPVLDEAREQAVLDRNLALLRDPSLRPFYAEVLRSLMAASRRWQEERP